MSGRPIIPVDYEFICGKHFFTARSGFGLGLCVAHGDFKTAYDEVGRQLKVILRENHEVMAEHDVNPLIPFEELRGRLSASGVPARVDPRTSEPHWTFGDLKAD